MVGDQKFSGPPGSFHALSLDMLETAFPEGNARYLEEQAAAVAAEVQQNIRWDTGREPPARPSLPWRSALVAGVLGTALGMVAVAGLGWISITLAALTGTVLASCTTLFFYSRLLRRGQAAGIVEGVLRIQNEGLEIEQGESEALSGQLLHYLEAKRDSDDLVVLLHGLGLDASDFRAYLTESKYHSVALTLYGFNPYEKDDEEYSPISLQSHARLFAFALQKLHKQYPDKRISLVGFSFGADMILLLSELAGNVLAGLKIHRVLLLDPNINQSTMTVSSKIAELDSGQPLEQWIEVLRSAEDLAELRNLCRYVYKATSKDLGQVQRHATEMVDVLSDLEIDRFLEYFTRLAKMAGGINVMLSVRKELFRRLRDRAFHFGLSGDCFRWSPLGHFELADPSFLSYQLDTLLNGGAKL